MEWERFWEKITEQHDTAMILKEFVEQTGKTSFTYSEVRMWYYGSGAFQRWNKDWHTIERLMRKLAELGYIYRVRYGRTVIFVLIPDDDTLDTIQRLRSEYALVKAVNTQQIQSIVKKLSVELGVGYDRAAEILMGQEVLDKWLK